MTSQVLAHSLQELEGDGIGVRQKCPAVPPHVEYSMNAVGGEGLGDTAATTATRTALWDIVVLVSLGWLLSRWPRQKPTASRPLS